MACPQYTHAREIAQYAVCTQSEKFSLGKISRDKPTGRRMSAIRRAQLRDVARHRIGTPEGCDVLAFAKAFAVILDESPRGAFKFKNSKCVTFLEWPGLDLYSLRVELHDLELDFDDGILKEALDYVYFRRREISDIIELTIEEREICQAWNLGMCEGETRLSRKMNGRQKSNLQRARVRRERGSVPRSEYEANSASRLKPWEAENISRSTWYRKIKELKENVTLVTEEFGEYERETGIAETLLIQGVPPPVLETETVSFQAEKDGLSILSAAILIQAMISAHRPREPKPVSERHHSSAGNLRPANDNRKKGQRKARFQQSG